MKIALPFLGILALLGVAYGLAFFGVIPAQKMADKSPQLASALIKLHLAKAKKPAPHGGPDALKTAAVNPAQAALNTQKTQLDAGRAQLAKDRADFDAQKQAAVAAPVSAPDSAGQNSAAPDSAAKLSAIYAAMSPDDLVTIFTKLPDPDIISALMGLDEKKAGKVLAALPPTRAARLTQQMAHPRPVVASTVPETLHMRL